MKKREIEKEDEFLEKRIPEMVEKLRKKGVKNILALDKSGRPVGLLVWKAWKKMYPNEKPELFFLDPYILKSHTNFFDKWVPFNKKETEEYSKKLEKEQPKLYKKIRKGEKVGVVDDFSFLGLTRERTLGFFKNLGNEKNFFFLNYKEKSKSIPYWYGKKKLLGVDGAEEKKEESFLVKRHSFKEGERREFVSFRKKLSGMAEKIAKKHKRRR